MRSIFTCSASKGRRVDGDPLVLALAVQFHGLGVARDPELELGGLALERHLHVLPVPGAGVLSVPAAPEELGGDDHRTELLAVTLLLDVL